ncbi:MAG: EAL domain-containing protein [Gammaproteobacteria bacterium]|nr:EAL domain-containing protein [Gammaproteobacteria bacterium]
MDITHADSTEQLNVKTKSMVLLGAFAIWAALALFVVYEYRYDRDIALKELNAEVRTESQSKTRELEALFQELYIATRTISLLPALRHISPQNRVSATDDVIDNVRFHDTDADVVQQLYNHAASIASISEIYITYAGFNPGEGEVPFVMYDNVIVDRIHANNKFNTRIGLIDNPSDIPVEDESEEYVYLSQSLKTLQRKFAQIPENAPDNIPFDISPIMITCDNSQYQSKSLGDPNNRLGFILSVPIYSDTDGTFKGLVSTVVRTNIIEARLIGWPNIPVTDQEKRSLAINGLANIPPSNYILTNNRSGMAIFDRRNSRIQQDLQQPDRMGSGLSMDIMVNGESVWTLHRLIPQEQISNILVAPREKLISQLLIFSLLVIILAGSFWYKFYRRLSTDLNHVAAHDALTGLPNRRDLYANIAALLEISRDRSQQLALLMIDLDKFKEINDSLGHVAGDQLLVEVARRFKESLRGSDTVAVVAEADADDAIPPSVGRLGGDEFLVILPNIGSQANAIMTCERLLSCLTKPISVDGYSVYCHASIGIALYPNHGDNSETLLRNADSAMYRAKKIRGCSLSVYDTVLSKTTVRHMRLLGDLHAAVINKEFFLNYQPIYDSQRDKIHTVEALLRWRHPEMGLISPDEFIPLLEQTGMIVDVGTWVLRMACRQLKEWASAGSTINRVSVNVSVVQLNQSDFSSTAIEVLKEENVNPNSIIIEITESVFIENSDAHINQLQKIRDAGSMIALDDFGTGYSSLNYLMRLPVDIIKIDRSMVVRHTDQTCRAILRALSDIARHMNIRCIAEGIETAEEYRSLVELNYSMIQGWLIAKPMLADEADRLSRVFGIDTLFLDKKFSSVPILKQANQH